VDQRRFYVRESAEAEIAGSVAWYEAKHAGLGLEFLAEVERTSSEIRSTPKCTLVAMTIVTSILV
jgi:hypothetical protein